MSDELGKRRTKKTNAVIRSAAASRVGEFEDEIERRSLEKQGPSADTLPALHPSDVHMTLPRTHAELQDHVIEHHFYDEESAERWSHQALINQHNELHTDIEHGSAARQYGEGFHHHQRPMRPVR